MYRYQYHPPKYDRGPLHPVQSPPPSDPTARNFIPGPFHLPRLRQTYDSTIAPDILTLAYQHREPGEGPADDDDDGDQRLRRWDGSSPYHKNRPLRPPRGGHRLRLVERDVTFRNVPRVEAVTLSCYVPQGIKVKDHSLVARIVIQAIPGVWP